MYIPVLLGIILLILIIVVLIVVLRQPYKVVGPLVFIHIPKNAGTTITKIGRDNGLEWRYQGCNSACSAWHVPPKDKLDKPSFCVVRNPYDRLLSQYSYSGSKKSLNEYITYKLYELEKNKHIEDCHFIPQVEYTRYATHILHFENLNVEFNQLMKEYNLDIQLNKIENVSHKKLSVENISDSNIELINRIYFEDFTKFGYKMK